ncbi:MAG: EamA family transporter [Anaerolineae bacterium]|nr:EamA family transporter [Anaerolineae bacterium]
MSPFVFIAFSTVLGICGQLLLKQGMNIIGHSSNSAGMVQRMVFSPWVIGGLLIYGTGVIFWLLALSNFELSYVYPFASLSYIGIIVGSYFLFRERITMMRVLGIAIIILGVVVTSQTG